MSLQRVVMEESWGRGVEVWQFTSAFPSADINKDTFIFMCLEHNYEKNNSMNWFVRKLIASKD